MNVQAMLTVAALIITPTAAAAHDAPLGWKYDFMCCSAADCREIKSSDIGEIQEGYQIKLSTLKEVVPYGSPKVKDSPDGRFHWCSYSGRNDRKTICLYVPPRAY